MRSTARGSGPLYDVQEACAKIRAFRDEDPTPRTRNDALLGEDLAAAIRSYTPTTSDAATAGHTLVTASQALAGMLAARAELGGGRTPVSVEASTIVNIASFAGLSLIEQAQVETDAFDASRRGYM